MRRFALALIPALLLPLIGPHALPSTVRAAGDPAVVTDGMARCPKNPGMYQGKISTLCGTTRRGNAQTPDFNTPTQPFAIDYAFNCGSKRRTFRMAMGLPGADLGVDQTTVWVTKRTGRGYKMVTQQVLDALGKLQPPNWTNVADIELKTTCAWHVVVVLGDKATIKAHVPTIPPYLPYSAYAG